jgi:hypothetical protein
MKIVISDIETNGLDDSTNCGSVVGRILLQVKYTGSTTVMKIQWLKQRPSNGMSQQT